MPDARHDIEKIMFEYAARVDAGDFAGMADLFAHATYRAGGDGELTIEGRDAVLQLMEGLVRRYEDGTPRTKHVTTNVIVDVDEAAGGATARSYFTVFQQVDDFRLQPIISGRYFDRFERVDGAWRLADRLIVSDLLGDLSRHLLVDPFRPAARP